MKDNLRAFSAKLAGSASGFYAYHTPTDSPQQYRLHLRILPNGTGILIINAATVMNLNETGTYFAWAKMQGGSEEETLKLIQKRYKEDITRLTNDYRNFISEIHNILQNPDQAPTVTSAGFNTSEGEEHMQIPIRANLCLTYRVKEDDPHDLTEQSTSQWKRKIKDAFDAGVPQILFFGGEPTLREDLLELLAYTEDLGLVSGLITASQRIIEEPEFIQKLIGIGLDHLVLEVDPNSVKPIDLKHIFDQDLFTCIRFKVSEDQNLFDWALELVELGANALNIYPANIEDSQKTAEFHQQLLNRQINLEHNLPFPLSETKETSPKLFSPDINEYDPDFDLVFLPDGTLSPESTYKLPVENLNS
ncbi:MAG: hypothetical protein ACOYKC_09325 [Anaerolineaceae bacterium]